MLYAHSTQSFYHPAVLTPIPPDAIPITDDEHQALIAGLSTGASIVADPDGRPTLATLPAPPPPTREEQIARIEAQIQPRLDTHARSRGYQNIEVAISYLLSNNPTWNAEARHLNDLRDATWGGWFACLATLAPTDPIPDWETVAASLPSLTWPA